MISACQKHHPPPLGGVIGFSKSRETRVRFPVGETRISFFYFLTLFYFEVGVFGIGHVLGFAHAETMELRGVGRS